MSYSLVIEKAADKYLRKLSLTERSRLVKSIMQLSENPDMPSLHIRKLKQSPYWRLRVGGFRIIFDRQDEVRIIRILKVGPRGDVYK